MFCSLRSLLLKHEIDDENDFIKCLLIEDFKILAWFRSERTKISCFPICLWSICCTMQWRKDNIWIAEYWRSLSSLHSSIQSHNGYHQKGMSFQHNLHVVEIKNWCLSCPFISKIVLITLFSQRKEPTTIAVRLFLRRTTRQRRLIPMKLEGYFEMTFVSLLLLFSLNKSCFFNWLVQDL